MTTLTLLTALGLAACADQNPIGPPLTRLPRQLSVAERELIQADNGFAFALLRQTLTADSEAVNVFVSPLSVSFALGMTLNGAAGATADSMRATLGFGALDQASINAGYRGLIDLLAGLDRSVTWSLANSIWYRNTYTFRATFLDAARTFFDAEVRPLDFAAADAGPTINRWVNDQTRGRIASIVPDRLPADMIMYLINAIYFRGNWTNRFDPSRTRPGPFRLEGGGTAQVPLMSASDMPLKIARRGGATMIELAYGRQAYAMTIVLPPPGVALRDYAAGLTRAAWDSMVGGLGSATLPLTMPKFTFQYALRLDGVLRSLGMGIAFCDGGDPNFTNMDETGRACISEVRHKTFVLVDEAGTEAAAVTSVGVGVTSAPLPVTIDRPFLFAIRERLSGTILFIGIVRNPAS